MGIKPKILLLVGLMITLMVTITTLIISQHTQQLSRDMSYRIAEETAHRYSQQVKAILDKSMEDARLLTITFKQLQKVSINRQVLDEILIETTRKGDYVFGSWTLWEPDAYDGLDAKFVNKPGHDETGRVNSYWHWQGDEIVNEPSVGWQSSSWYQTPKKRMKETLVDPYFYQVSGQDSLLISVISPIMINGLFQGITGIDVKLHALQDMVSKLRVLDSGYTTLIANNGIYAAHPNKALIGKIMPSSDENDPLLKAIRSGLRFESLIVKDELLAESAFRISIPILLSETESPWGLVVTIPNSEIIAPSKIIGRSIFLIGLVSGILMLIILTLLVRKIITPITRMTQSLASIAGSHSRIIPQLKVTSRDEVGMLASSFNILATDLNDSHSELERVNKDILRLNVDLEIRVAKRTEELSNSNTELLQAIAAADAANKAKSRFLAHMSHELRTPLNAILGLSELMCMDKDLSRKHADNLNIINNSGEHLLAMINDVLDLSKIESGNVEINKNVIKLHEFLNNIFRMMSVHAGKKDISLDTDFILTDNVQVLADEGKLRQVLINLINNAIKFTSEGGVNFKCYFEGGHNNDDAILIFEIIDTGIGIAIEHLDDVFKPFVQLDNVVEGEEGTGLGLAISHNYIQIMGGELEASRRTDQGTTFKICLPVNLVDDRVEETIDQQDKLDKGKVSSIAQGQDDFRILIVEDSAENRLLLGAILRRVGINYKEAVNGEEAIEAYQNWQPDLIWMDMRMPVKDGYEATQEIRQLPGGDQVKIIALTASAFKEEQSQILAAGCDALLLKPYRPQQIYSILAQQLGVKFEY